MAKRILLTGVISTAAVMALLSCNAIDLSKGDSTDDHSTNNNDVNNTHITTDVNNTSTTGNQSFESNTSATTSLVIECKFTGKNDEVRLFGAISKAKYNDPIKAYYGGQEEEIPTHDTEDAYGVSYKFPIEDNGDSNVSSSRNIEITINDADGVEITKRTCVQPALK